MDKLLKEKKLQKKGFSNIIGIDEAGRGALAGPVVAAAVFVKDLDSLPLFILKNVNNSKKISERKREEIFRLLWNKKDIYWRTGKISPAQIDDINILNATKLAMRKALHKLERQYNLDRNNSFLILDGNFKIKASLEQEAVIQGDDKIFSCMLASIIAKVTRDRIMKNFEKKYPGYGFKKHKGYGTEYHRKKIKNKGASIIHRKTFNSVL